LRLQVTPSRLIGQDLKAFSAAQWAKLPCRAKLVRRDGRWNFARQAKPTSAPSRILFGPAVGRQEGTMALPGG